MASTVNDDGSRVVCSCKRVHVGLKDAGLNIDPDCPLHGIGTDYYAEQEAKWRA